MSAAATDELTSRLLDPDKNVRIAAVIALGELADLQTLPSLLARLGTEPDFFVRDNLIWAIVRMGDAAVLPVIDLLGDADRSVRFHAAHALSKLADPRAVEALVRSLDDSDAEVAQKATYALGRIHDVRSLPALVSRLGTRAGEAQSTLHDALVEFGDEAVPMLMDRAAGADAKTRVAIVEILGNIGGPTVVPALADAMDDAEWEVRFAAVNALRGASGNAAHTALQRAAADQHAHVRAIAARLLSGGAAPQAR